jgi:hypothetical protein
MKHWINKNYKSLIIAAFLIPIITVAVVSISHVTKWYGISNPVSWAIYLSIGVEIAALSALAAISADMGKKVYFPFAIVTLVQFIGNIFFAYSFIDLNSQSFKDWVDLVSPLVSFMGVEPNDFVGHKRFLAFFAGGMLPIISLSFLHMLVKFTEEDRKKEETLLQEERVHLFDDKIIEDAIEKYKKEQELKDKIDAKDLVGEVSRLRLSEEDLKKLEEVLLNPPPPNENLKEAAEEYNKKINEETVSEKLVISDEEILKLAKDIETRRIFELAQKERERLEKEFGPTNIEEEPFSIEIKKDVLDEMTQQNQEMGLYDSPFINPIVKEENLVIEPKKEEEDDLYFEKEEIVNDKPTSVEEKKLNLKQVVFEPSEYWVDSKDSDDEDGFEQYWIDQQEKEFSTIEPTEEEESRNFSNIEPTEEEESRNFSNIEPNSDNIFQKEDYEGQFEDWKNETVVEPFATENELIPVDEAVDNEPEITEFSNDRQTETYSQETTILDESSDETDEKKK